MGSDFIASILLKCHKIRAIERFLPVRFSFPRSFKWSQWFPVLSTWPHSGWNGSGKASQARWRSEPLWRHVLRRHCGRQDDADLQVFFFKKLLNSHTLDVESVSCLVLRLHEAECAHLDFSFARMRRIVDRSNLRGATTSHWGQSRGAVPLGSREETEAVRCQARAVTPLAGVTSPPGTHVWLTVAVWR